MAFKALNVLAPRTWPTVPPTLLLSLTLLQACWPLCCCPDSPTHSHSGPFICCSRFPEYSCSPTSAWFVPSPVSFWSLLTWHFLGETCLAPAPFKLQLSEFPMGTVCFLYCTDHHLNTKYFPCFFCASLPI